jgi:hypothetical protein
MRVDAKKLRVVIPTTNGPVEVLLLTEEDPGIGRCVACIGGTTETANIAAAYHAFVVRPTGVIERLFGHPCYRLDVSGQIDAGSSWQLGALAAHALHAAGRLAQEDDSADGVLWATGSVRPVDLTVGGVSHVLEKLTSSMDRLKEELSAGREVVLAIPQENAASLAATVMADLAALGAEVIELSHVQALFDALAVKRPEGPPRIGKTPAAAGRTKVSAPSRRRYIWGAAAVALLCGASAAVYLLGRPLETVATPRPAQQTPVAQNKPERLVPELVPFVSERDRATIRDLYMSAPDFKALALSSSHMRFVTAQPNQDIADKAALDACKALVDATRAEDVFFHACDLYASGNVVVASRAHPPLPPAPWVVRDPSIERPFVAADIPLVGAAARERAERNYRTLPKSKAYVVAPGGIPTVYYGEPDPEQASRRALERCGYITGTACMVIAIDDIFVVPIPTVAKVVGFYRLDALTAVAPELRDDIARRLRNAASGWNAVAIGASGRIGIKLGAESEQAAIDGSMEGCRKQDRDCRIAVIGPFMVEGAP